MTTSPGKLKLNSIPVVDLERDGLHQTIPAQDMLHDQTRLWYKFFLILLKFLYFGMVVSYGISTRGYLMPNPVYTHTHTICK